MTEPMKCWCGNEPSFSTWASWRHNTFGCMNHPTKHKRIDHTMNTVYSPINVTDEELIQLWNEKVRKHNEVVRKRNQNCPGCGEHYQDKWTFCPYCGTRLELKSTESTDNG